MFQCSTGLEISSNTEIDMHNNTETQEDFSVIGIIAMDIKSKTNNKFKARTILGTRAGTNFLPYI